LLNLGDWARKWEYRFHASTVFKSAAIAMMQAGIIQAWNRPLKKIQQ